MQRIILRLKAAGTDTPPKGPHQKARLQVAEGWEKNLLACAPDQNGAAGAGWRAARGKYYGELEGRGLGQIGCAYDKLNRGVCSY